MNLTIHTDGGARGNPGPSGFGFVVYDDQKNIVHQGQKFLGTKTNNEAEYEGLIAALTWARENKDSHHLTSLQINMDSQLIVRQVNGLYKVKTPHLKPLYQLALHLISQLSIPVTFTDIRREQNSLADQLANQAMDQGK